MNSVLCEHEDGPRRTVRGAIDLWKKQDGYMESFNGYMRYELLNESLFLDLARLPNHCGLGRRLQHEKLHSYSDPVVIKALRLAPFGSVSATARSA
jgi:hypothetical protein